MSSDGLDIQHDWDFAALHGSWPVSIDSRFLHDRLAQLPVAVTARGARGRVLEVAAAEAVHSCKLSLRGLECVVLEPSPVMIAEARRRMAEYGARLTFVRGIGEKLPFPDATFERVLCESSIDHFAGPDLGVREMMRVCKPDGRVVIGAVNYGSLSVRLSRLLYRLFRRLGRVDPDEHLFWDSPVPLEHSFECTYQELLRMGRRYGDLEETMGVSLGWSVPGWSGLLDRLDPARAASLLERLDAIAQRVPRWADYVLTVWRPRAANGWAQPGDPTMRVSPEDPAYRWKADAEARYWGREWSRSLVAVSPALESLVNRGLTGDPARSWLDDLIGRGPFDAAAMLGCDDAPLETAWIGAGASPRLDVYEMSAGMVRHRRAAAPAGVRFVEADLNFVRLPEERYDVIWSSGCLHHIVNLEHLLDQVTRALRPGGVFAFHDYIGEARFDFEPRRLARVNAALHDVPVRFRRDRLEAISRDLVGRYRSPFCAVRSNEVLSAARARFQVVHEVFTAALFPLALFIDVDALAREAPDVLQRVLAAEAEALADPTLRPCEAYVVFRRS
jgi:ubiquinone/menaquinone biosynthesis C-methylase UbiE